MSRSSIEITVELARLSALTIFELRGEWRRLYRTPPPMRLSRDLLTRGITYKLQERSLGGLSNEWNGKRHRSLTVIAREITGAHWSGPRFFGLRKCAGGSAESAEDVHARA
jgi:hypothetical protein